MFITPTKKPKALIFDVDHTLTEGVTWYKVTEKLGASTYTHADIFMRFLDGKISYQKAKQELFKIWLKNGPVSKQKLIEVFENIHIKGEAISLLNELQNKGYTICLISGSIDMFVKILANRLGIKHAYGNSKLRFDEEDNWIDLEYTKNEAMLKVEQLEDFLEKTGFTKEECIAIGDGENDFELFRVIPGIAVNSGNEHIARISWQNIKYLTRVSQILETLE